MPNPYEGDPRCIALYDGLPQLTGDDIRQVTLHSGQFEDEIRCSLTIKSFDSEYEALSYTWQLEGQPSIYQIMDQGDGENGDEAAGTHQSTSSKTQDDKDSSKHVEAAPSDQTQGVETTITVNEMEVPVMLNLAQALRYLRQPSQDSILWIDYLCIDQNSDADRTAQVRRMDEIYSRAKRVVVWLGLEAPNDETAFKELQLLAKGQHIDRLYPKLSPRQIHKRHEPLLDLFERGYWCRMWTVQETALAREAVVRVGYRELSWDVFLKARDTVRRHKQCCDFILDSIELAHVTRRIDVIEQAVLDPFDGWFANLPGAMIQARSRTATDPRDRVFSLLGIITLLNRPKSERPLNKLSSVTDIQADYSLSERDVYEKVTLELIEQNASLDILIRSGNFSGRPGFPSWVADLKFRHDDGAFLTKFFSAIEHRRNVKRCSKDNLRSVGIPFESVAKVGPPLRRFANALSSESIRETYDTIRAWEEIHEATKVTPYGSVEAWQDALWQTICLGWCVEEKRQIHPRDSKYYEKWRWWLEVAAKGSLGYRFSQFWGDERVRRRQLFTTEEKKSFFTTGAGYYGMAYPSAEPGDVVCVLSGARLPFLLRQLDEICTVCEQPCFRIVGFAYLQGIMNGELVVDHHRGHFTSTVFCLK